VQPERSARLSSSQDLMPLDELEQDVGALTGKSAELQSRLKQREGGVSGLADKALESVFTIETDSSLGAGFAAWEEAGVIYVITANHVVVDARSAFVTISRKGLVSGQIVGEDRKNDLALIRVSGRPRGAAPLWQQPRRATPSPGEELVLDERAGTSWILLLRLPGRGHRGRPRARR
jgi:S1-C subfamily serine protease